jgi:hypothetical protein
VAVHLAKRYQVPFSGCVYRLSPGKSAYAVHRGDACERNGSLSLQKQGTANCFSMPAKNACGQVMTWRLFGGKLGREKLGLAPCGEWSRARPGDRRFHRTTLARQLRWSSFRSGDNAAIIGQNRRWYLWLGRAEAGGCCLMEIARCDSDAGVGGAVFTERTPRRID